MEKYVVYYKLHVKNTFLVMSYYLINNHIEIPVLIKGKLQSKQLLHTSVRLQAKKLFFSYLRSNNFLSRLAAKVCISYSVVLEDARLTLE